jgi:hypothetical protein
MFEKCELATYTPRDPNNRDIDVSTSATLKEDFNEFANQVSIVFFCYEFKNNYFYSFCLFSVRNKKENN